MYLKFAFKPVSIALAATIFITGCTSTTLIQSTPSGADVYIDNQKMGVTPYTYSDQKIVGSSTPILLKKAGYKDLNVMLQRTEQADVGAIIGGCLVLVPFLWVCDYNPMHNYSLESGTNDQNQSQPAAITPQNNAANSAAPAAAKPAGDQSAELTKLKTLSDESAITADEYSLLKGKVLDNTYDYSNSPADQLIKLKSWLDQKLVTADEYKAKKNKIIYGN